MTPLKGVQTRTSAHSIHAHAALSKRFGLG
jgi:hypothetical protein